MMATNKRTIRVCLTLVLFALIVSVTGGRPVSAQTTTLSLAPLPPENPTALTCIDTVIAVRVENVTNLYSYDIWLEFTPGSIEVWEVTNGSFLTFGYYNIPVVVDNEAGTIHITMTQTSPALPKSGSGDLIYIRLRAFTPDASFQITFDDLASHPTRIFDGLGGRISHTKINGSYTTSDCEPAGLSFTPPSAILCVNNSQDIFVRVDNVLDLYAYDLDLTFNPGAISIASVSNSTFLSQGIPAPENAISNTNGTVNFGMTQTLSGTNLPRDGSGNLIKITLTATIPGQSVVMNIANTSMLASWSDYYGTNPIMYNATVGRFYTANCDPTAVIFDGIDAQLQPNYSSIKVLWNTFSEVNITGFNVLRSETLSGTQQKINGTLIPAFFTNGGEHFFIDDAVTSGHTYYYWIQAVKESGAVLEIGPKEIFAGSKIFLPIITFH